MKRRKKSEVRVVEVPTEYHVRLVKQFKGSQVIVEVTCPPEDGLTFEPIRLTRHVKDGKIILGGYRAREDPILLEDGTARLDGKGRPMYEVAQVHEYWRVG